MIRKIIQKGFRERYITLRTWIFQTLFIFFKEETSILGPIDRMRVPVFIFCLVHGLFFLGKMDFKKFIYFNFKLLGRSSEKKKKMFGSEMKEFYLSFIKTFHKYFIARTNKITFYDLFMCNETVESKNSYTHI